MQNIRPLLVDIENFNSRVFMPWSINYIKISSKRAAWANFVYARKHRYYASRFRNEDLLKNYMVKTEKRFNKTWYL